MTKLIPEDNSDGQLFSNKITFNRKIHLLEEALMTYLLKIVPWIQNGMSGQTRRNTKFKTGRRAILKGILTDRGLVSGPYSVLFNLKT